MATEKLLELLQRQMEQQQLQLEQQQAMMATQEKSHQEQIQVLMFLAKKEPAKPFMSAWPSFSAFDSASELWTDYWARFKTFTEANSVPEEKKAYVFLTNQTPVTYKLLTNLASQQTPPNDVNQLSIKEISEFMMEQFHPKRFIVRERFKFWSNMDRKPGETIQELVARIRQDAVTCDFTTIKDPLDEAMRTRFICSINNEAVLKALFKVKDDELTFAKAIGIAIQTEDAAKVAKETVHGQKSNQEIKKIQSNKKGKSASFELQSPSAECIRCGRTGHSAKECRFKKATCHYCSKVGHLEAACLKKRRDSENLKGERKKAKKIYTISQPTTVNKIKVPELQLPIKLEGQHTISFEVDTGAGDNFLGKNAWSELGRPELQEPAQQFESASQHKLPVLGTVTLKAETEHPQGSNQQTLGFNVTELPDLNLLGRNAIKQLGISVDTLMEQNSAGPQCHAVFEELKPDRELQEACHKLCEEFPDLFKPELGKLKDFELEVKFKPDANPVFCKARSVPFALQEDLVQTYEAGVTRGVWQRTQFNEYGTPVVPIRKPVLPGQTKAKLRVCGDYSVAVNAQLETHRHPIPTPEKLMQKLSGGSGFTKIDLADAYNQIALGPESQKRLALSTHQGVLLQMRLPFGISSAPGYFQEIMDQLTSDLPGVAVYLDDILVSGSTAQEHLRNLRRLLQRLNDKGLRCRLEKCAFAQPYVEYLGHLLSNKGTAKGTKVDAVMKMPAPTNVSGLRSFLGSVQFYSKFLSNLSTSLEPLYRLTKKGVPWMWGAEEKAAFDAVKRMLCEETVLAHFDPSLPIGVACDASEVGIGAVLFHRYTDGSERPIANVSKTLTETQRKYSQIQREALSIIFALRKFHQFLYGRKFVLVTDHKPLLALFGPTKATPALAANRLARWALMLSQYDYTIEYRKSADHANADALSRLPVGPDPEFDGKESSADTDCVCTIKTISLQLNPGDPGVLSKETAKDRVLATVMRYTREGWPLGKIREVNKDTEDTAYTVDAFKKIRDSLSVSDGCLFYGARVVIPASLQPQVLEILHLGHFGMQRMKQLARTAVYWPGIDSRIVEVSRACQACAEHQNKPSKPPVHPWMFPEKPWSRLHLDHAINFLGSNWLVLTDAYSNYPCIHPTSSTSSKATIDLLEQDFAHFGYPHTLVTDNATSFTSEEFQEWCKSRGITHLTGAPYHPATNGAAERLVQTFEKSMTKSASTPKTALQQFLMQYRRTPLPWGYSPSELLNGRQIRTPIDVLIPSPAHQAQGRQCKQAVKAAQRLAGRPDQQYKVGMPCYALYCGPRRDKDPRWVPAVVTKVRGTRCVTVRVYPKGPIWRRHVEQLRPRYFSAEDEEPGGTQSTAVPASTKETESSVPGSPQQSSSGAEKAGSATLTADQEARNGDPGPSTKRKRPNPRMPTGDEYGPDRPRRSTRLRKRKH